jgi:hypothetical protein
MKKQKVRVRAIVELFRRVFNLHTILTIAPPWQVCATNDTTSLRKKAVASCVGMTQKKTASFPNEEQASLHIKH